MTGLIYCRRLEEEEKKRTDSIVVVVVVVYNLYNQVNFSLPLNFLFDDENDT